MKNRTKFLAWIISIMMITPIVTASAQTPETGIYYTGSPSVTSSATDASGNIFVSGFYAGSNYTFYDLDPGPLTINPRQDATDSFLDAFVAKYSSSGTLLWTASAITESNCNNLEIRKMTTDASGNLFVMGNVWGLYAQFWDSNSQMQIDGANFSSGFQARPFVVKIDSDGELQWAYSYYANSVYDYLGYDLALDASGNVFIAGTYSATSKQAAIWKLSGSGVFQSISLLGTGTEAHGMTIDGSSNIFLGGVFYSTADMDPSGTTNNLSGNVDGDAFLAKYNSSITYQWAQRLTTSGTKETAKGVVFDGSGNLFVSADAGSTLQIFKRTSGGAASTSISLTTSGTTFDPRHLKINSANEIFISGSLNGAADFDPGAGTSSQSGGNYVAKYNNTLAFSYRIGSGSGLALTSGGKVVVGSSTETVIYTEGTADTTVPIISTYSPTDNATNVAIASNLVATFEENITPVSGRVISIKRSSDNVVFESYTLPSANISVSGSVVTINPTGNFLNGTGYYVTIDAGTFKDPVGNNYAGIVSSSVWNFTTVSSDATPPTISSLSPLDNATGVSPTANLVITFSESVSEVSTKAVSIKRSSDNAVFESYILPSGNVTTSGTNVTINPTGALVSSTEYYVNIEAGAFEDEAGNDFIGITNSTTWSFTTPSSDVTPPSVVSLSPVDGTTSGAGNTNFVITFNEDVFVNDGTSFRFRRVSNNSADIILTTPNAGVTVNGASVTINPSVDFSLDNTEYWVEITSGIRDANNNFFAGLSSNTTWNFTTGDVNSPTFNSLSPNDEATSVAITKTPLIYFTENIFAVSSKTVSIKRISDNAVFVSYTLPSSNVVINNTTVAILHAAPFDYSTGYYINIEAGAFEDAAGNDFAGINNNSTWNFTSAAAPADGTPPAISTLSPTNSETSVVVGTDLVATFSENITAVNGKLVQIVQVSGDIVIHSYTLPSAQVDVSGATVVINPATDLPTSTALYVYIQAGAFEDASGNDFAGITNSSGWSFTTSAPGDVTPPTVVSLNPVNTGTNLAVDASLQAIFSENISAVATKVVSIKRVSDNVVFESYTLPSGNVGVGANAVTINPTGVLLNSTSYYVTIEAGAFQDASGNPFAGITNNTTWNFTTAAPSDTQPPVIVSSIPVSGATGVSVNLSEITVTFDENIFSGNSNNLILSGGAYYEYYDFNNPNQAFFDGNVLHLYPTTTLPDNTLMNVYLYDHAIKDANDNYIPGYQFSFTTASLDVTGPAISALSPEDNAADAAIGANLVATFSENVAAVASKVVSIKHTSDNSVFESFTLPSGNVNVSGATVTINPTGDMINSTGYYVNMEAGSFEDVAGNDFAGITNNSTWNFTTAAPPDETPPNVTAFSPVNGATDVSINTALVMAFDEPVRLATNGATKWAILWGGTGGTTVLDLTNTNVTTISGNSVTMAPGTLQNGTTYYVTLGDDIFEDYASNWMPGWVGNSTWSFTTAKADQTINFGSLPVKVFGDADFDLNATASSGLTVSYNSSNASVATVSGSTITIVGGGSTTITASQAGNSTYNAAPSVQQTLTINKDNQTITFNPLSAKSFGDPDFDLIATASSGLAVSYSSSNTAVATISGNSVTIAGAGSTTITASQAGNANYNAATNVLQTLTINKASQVITFNDIPTQTIGNPDFSLSASSSSGLSVSFSSSNLNVATISGNIVTVVGSGSSVITASQDGNDNYEAALSVDKTLVVTDPAKQNQTITFGSLSAKTFGDAGFDLTASASSGLGVSYSSSNQAIATIDGATLTIVGAGSVVITANQTGNDSFNPAPPVEQTLLVNKADQAITFGPLSAKTFGDDAFIVSASASSGLAVSFESSNTTVASINGTTITIAGAGSATITAIQAGNANYNAATSVEQVLTINKADQTITFNELSSKTFGDPDYALEGSASSGLGLSYLSSDASVAAIDGTTVIIVGAGSATITAIQGGDTNYNSATPVGRVLTVNKADQTISFGPLAAVNVGDPPFSLNASASSGLTVSYSSSNTEVATVSGSMVTIVGQGTTTITASQTGNASYNSAISVDQTLLVNTPGLQEQSITFAELPDKTFGDASFDLTATASSGLTVSYSSSNTLVAAINGTTVTIVGAGSTVITASQPGDGTYNPATDVQRTFTVNKASQTITFAALTQKILGDEDFSLSATATSGLPVSYSSSNLNVATVNGATVTIVGAGTATITATQAGNNNYNPATPVEQVLTVNPRTRIIELSGDLSFDELILPETSSKPFTISNAGNDDLAITNIMYPPGFTGNVTNGMITPGESLIVMVTFTPTEPKEYAGDIQVTSNATSGNGSIAVSGAGVTVTGIEPTFDNAPLSVYPNPGTGVFTIEVINPKGDKIMVCDLLGRVSEFVPMKWESENRYQFNISHQASGIYVVKVQTEYGVKLARVIKNN